MNTQQKADYKTWKNNPEQPLPESLKNVLVDKCFNELINSDTAKARFAIIHLPYSNLKYDKAQADSLSYSITQNMFEKMLDSVKISYVLSFLSRTPNGEVVMPFLDVESPEYRQTLDSLNEYQPQVRTLEQYKQLGKMDYQFCIATKTLDHLLYREFTEALRTGKNLKQSLETITKTYLLNINE